MLAICQQCQLYRERKNANDIEVFLRKTYPLYYYQERFMSALLKIDCKNMNLKVIFARGGNTKIVCSNFTKKA